MNLDLNKILDEVNNRNLFLRIVITMIGSFLLAINYNVFLEPNNLVIGGLSGLAIVTKKIFSWNPTTFIYIATSFLLLISTFLLEKKELIKGIFVSIVFPFFITLTGPLSQIILKYLQFNDKIIIALVSALLYGFACGIIYKVGFNTGGLDFLMKIVNKYAKISEGKASFSTSITIVLIGAITFDVNNVVYSAIILYLSSIIIDRMLIGISTTKVFFIETKKVRKMKKFIIEELKTGVTIIDMEGGYTQKKGKMLMCVVDSKDYYIFRESIQAIDPKAFLIVNDCYEVAGGVKRERINLLER